MIGQIIGTYEVTALLGKGGMGEVYRARDSKLDREVALKILPDELSSTPDRLARFEREAKVLASLQHQNIASIYGFEEVDGQPVLVMELAEGDDLSQRIADGSLTSTEIEKIARQLARGLEYAHEKGIIHRDLKPANVKIFGDGQVKILDFGLARAFTNGPATDSSTNTQFQPTLTQGLTIAGTVLGTAAYMSPEQARGYDVDRRSDIWAFGVILYEMLTGVRLFEGDTASDTMAAILRQEPDWNSFSPETSSLMIQICRRCLEKDPQNRMRDIGEVRVALEGSSASVIGLSTVGELPLPMKTSSTRGNSLPWVAAGSLALALGTVLYLALTGAIGPQPDPPAMIQSSVTLPKGVQMNLNPAAPGPVSVSPDSRHLAFTALDSTGKNLLYIRDLDKPKAFAIPNTEGAHYPFWSPNSRTVAFFTPSNKLARVDIAGGPIVTICPAENGKGGSWNENDQILFAPSHISSIFMVPATGGQPVDITGLGSNLDFRSHRFPKWLPGNNAFLYIAVSRSGSSDGLDSSLRIASIDSTINKTLMPCQTSAEFASGEILFVHDSILMARPFDPEIGEFMAPARPILDGILALPAAHLSVMSASSSGVLAFSSGGGGGFGNSQLFILDSDGTNETPIHQPLMTFGYDLSPDGNQMTLSLPDAQNGTFDIWTLDIERNLRTRFTFDPESEMKGIWSPDSEWMVYASDRKGYSVLNRKKTSGTGSAELLLELRADITPTDWSRDGNLLAYTKTDSTGKYVLGLYDFTKGESKPFHAEVGYSEANGSFSPNGQWLAYSSSETGEFEVFVESLQPEGGRWRVSANGGFSPTWAPSGDRLYYQTAIGEILAVEVSENDKGGLRFGATEKITERVEYGILSRIAVNRITGQLIVKRSTQAKMSSLLSLVSNWQQLLPKEN
jgi:eukaryotic-like serine/threonine-protein kinase